MMIPEKENIRAYAGWEGVKLFVLWRVYYFLAFFAYPAERFYDRFLA
jgi:hypothetical protein